MIVLFKICEVAHLIAEENSCGEELFVDGKIGEEKSELGDSLGVIHSFVHFSGVAEFVLAHIGDDGLQVFEDVARLQEKAVFGNIKFS